ncbi:MAG: carboxylesterase [Gammaproteobacteria bacterium]|nr:carboxylesterase [Gammaproteobacteria bacterium]
MPQLETVDVSTGANPTGSIIWLHGLGADGHDFEPIVPELRLPAETPLRFVFPHAPVRPVTVNGGMEMRAWYDILSLDSEGRADAAGIIESTALVEELVDREVALGMPEEKIVVAGFSQGGAVAINTMLTTGRELAGLMALSTYLALPASIETSASRKDLPVFMAHGSSDPVLPIQWGRDSAAALAESGYSPEWCEYPMAHAVCPQEIADIRNWLLKVYG